MISKLAYIKLLLSVSFFIIYKYRVIQDMKRKVLHRKLFRNFLCSCIGVLIKIIFITCNSEISISCQKEIHYCRSIWPYVYIDITSCNFLRIGLWKYRHVQNWNKMHFFPVWQHHWIEIILCFIYIDIHIWCCMEQIFISSRNFILQKTPIKTTYTYVHFIVQVVLSLLTLKPNEFQSLFFYHLYFLSYKII